MDNIYNEASAQMDKAINAMKREFKQLRTGRANTAMVDHVEVEMYGAKSPIAHVASVSTPDAQTIMITPFDRSQIAAVEKGIQEANLGLNPSSDGANIRLTVPALTQERRKEIVKEAHKLAEDGKISIRHARHEANDAIKQMEKDKDISEDDRDRGMKKVQELTDKHTKTIDDLLAKKEAEIMTV